MEKKLKISLDLDDKSFNSAVKRMQEQLNKINSGPQLQQQQRQISQKMQQMGLGALPGAPTDREMQRTQQTSKQQTDKVFEETRRKMEVIKKLQTELNKEQSNGLATEQRKLDIEEKLSRLKKQELRTTGELTTLVNKSGGGGMSAGGKFGAAAGAAGALIGGAGAIVGSLGRLPIEAASAAGTAATTLVSNQLKEMADPYHQAFLPERGKAIAAAKKAWKAGQYEDKALNIAASIGGAIALAGVGAAAIALTGGAATPAVIAGGSAAIGGLGGSVGALFGTSKQRALTTGNTAAYEQLSSRDLANLTTESIKAQEEANPLKKMAAEYNAQNYQRNLGIQRGLGLNDEGLMGKTGFLRSNMAPGGNMQFTEEQVTQMQQSLLAAGGSARMGRNAGYGLELQKNLNLTNSPQMLANISKTMGGAAETKEASTRVISEAFKDGLNDSDLVDLLRSFTQTTSEYIAKSGAKTPEDVKRITEQFGKGVIEKTGVGMEAAKTAYEAYQSLSGQQGGPFSIMQRGAMLRSPQMKRLAKMGREGAQLFEAIKKTPEQELTENHPVIQATLDLLNKGMKPGEKGYTTAKDIQNIKKESTMAGADITGGLQEYNTVIDKWEKDNGMSIEEGMQKGLVTGPARHAALMRGITVTATGTGAMPNITSAQGVMAAGAQFGSGMGRKEAYGPEEALKTTQKQADQINANIAATQTVFIDNFTKFKDSIVPAASNLDTLTQKLVLLGQVAADVASGKNPDKGALSRGVSILSEQHQANSSSSAGK